MNYYRRYMADYLSKTASLSLIEHGAYCLLLDYAYLSDGRLPGELDAIHRMVRAISATEREAVGSVLKRFFVLADGAYINPRVTQEVEKAKPAMEAARTNGVKGGRPKNNPVGFSEEPSAKASQPLTPNPQPPTPDSQPLTPNHQKRTASGRAARRPAPEKDEGRTTPCWQAYSAAYVQRYAVDPVRNAKVSGMLAKFLERVPADEAPEIAAFYVRSNRGLYLSSKHCIDLLLRDAEGIRTEWATGRTVTDTEARRADRTQATGNAFAGLIAEAEEREAHAK